MMTLRTLILQTLSDGEPVTAEAMSRLWGEDRVRCQEWLDKYVKLGVVSRRLTPPNGNRRKSRERGPVPLYIPNVPAVMAELARTS